MAVSKEVFESAGLIANNLAKYSVKLLPSNGHFERLVTLSSPQIEIVGEEPSYESADLEFNTNILHGNGETHSDQMEEFVQMYLRGVISRVDTLRRKIIPFVDQLVSELSSKQIEASFQQTEIRLISTPDLYQNAHFVEFIKRHKALSKMQTQGVKLMGGFMDRDENAIAELLRSGNTSLDDVLTDMIASYPSNWLVDTYKKYMVEGSLIPTNIDVVRQREYVDQAIVLYFIYASMIVRDVIDGTVNVKLEELRSYMTKTFSELGGIINQFVYKIIVTDQVANVLAYYDANEDVAYCHEKQYNEVIGAGVNIEAILAALKTNSSTNVTYLTKNAQQLNSWYMNYYQKEMDAQRLQFKPKLAKHFAEVFPVVFRQQPGDVQALFNGCAEGLVINPLSLTDQTVIALTGFLNKQMDSIRSANIYEIVSQLVVRIGLARWKFYGLLVAIEKYIKENGDNDPRRAVFHVLMEELPGAIIAGNVEISR